MAVRIPPEVLAAMREVARKTGAIGGKTAAANMTAAERKARAQKASEAAALKRKADRLAGERTSRKR